MKEQVYYDHERGFITETVHGTIPEHAIPVTPEEHNYFLNEANTGDKELCVVDGKIALRNIDYPPESIASIVRQERDAMLKGSDWSQLPDAPTAIKERYQLYRQKLRDISDQDGFPFDIEWPTL